ncbi:MAG: dihydrolipoyl dehydrogenase [Pseudomonadota bacterium]|nr:dihydrolipoyl dehydrogenase [Pseudomonadota bacterium]
MDIIETNVVVIGSGPAGYAAAFRAQDLGVQTLLIEKYSQLGGVCLNVGCIPSKAYLSVAEKIHDAKSLSAYGAEIDVSNLSAQDLHDMKQEVVGKLAGGLGMLAKKRRVQTITGEATFIDSHSLLVKTESGDQEVKFKHAIIATGSEPNRLPFLPEDERIFDSTGALQLKDISGHLVVIGGGIIGCEMATIYQLFGAQVTVLEVLPRIMMGADKKHAEICQAQMEKLGIEFRLGVDISSVDNQGDGIVIDVSGEKIECDQILYSVGRKPNGTTVGADAAGVLVDDKGFIPVDEFMRTNQEHIYAVGDVAKTHFDNQMLAHRSTAHGHLAAEIIAGHNIRYDIRAIPSVAYTDPEVAWVGISEEEAKEQGCKVGVFPWMASGRSLATGQGIGETKVYADANTQRILGASIVGRQAGEIIGVFCLAVEMGATLTDLALTVMPHPTLVESASLACEVALETITDL